MERKDIEQLASLARIDLKETEKDEFVLSMNDILGFVGEVRSIASHEKEKKADGLFNVMRADVSSHQDGEYTEAILAAAPGRKGQYIQVKKILGGTE